MVLLNILRGTVTSVQMDSVLEANHLPSSTIIYPTNIHSITANCKSSRMSSDMLGINAMLLPLGKYL